MFPSLLGRVFLQIFLEGFHNEINKNEIFTKFQSSIYTIHPNLSAIFLCKMQNTDHIDSRVDD